MIGAKCAYCGQPFAFWPMARRPIVEHVEPLSRGGTDTPENRVPACAGCNTSKSDSFLLEWVWRRAGLLSGRGRALSVSEPRPEEAPIAVEWRLGAVLEARADFMTLSELSRRSGLSYPTVHGIANGTARRADFATLGALCRELSVQPCDLLVYVGDKPKRGRKS